MLHYCLMKGKFVSANDKFDIMLEIDNCPLFAQFEMEQNNELEWTPPNERKYRPAVYFKQCSQQHEGNPSTLNLKLRKNGRPVKQPAIQFALGQNLKLVDLLKLL
ncbi:hypothetical protein M3Y97_00161200 [Aphelenchoides bicaudatus]|nr:hypothetical protein M3Y97_00161200 [Aphelenchoides bicaudatus]